MKTAQLPIAWPEPSFLHVKQHQFPVGPPTSHHLPKQRPFRPDSGLALGPQNKIEIWAVDTQAPPQCSPGVSLG